jgi:hypothetical protein
MVQFNFVSESEMFTTDLHYKMFDTSQFNYYKSMNGPMKHEDACENLRSVIGFTIKRFEKIF